MLNGRILQRRIPILNNRSKRTSCLFSLRCKDDLHIRNKSLIQSSNRTIIFLLSLSNVIHHISTKLLEAKECEHLFKQVFSWIDIKLLKAVHKLTMTAGNSLKFFLAFIQLRHFLSILRQRHIPTIHCRNDICKTVIYLLLLMHVLFKQLLKLSKIHGFLFVPIFENNRIVARIVIDTVKQICSYLLLRITLLDNKVTAVQMNNSSNINRDYASLQANAVFRLCKTLI